MNNEYAQDLANRQGLIDLVGVSTSEQRALSATSIVKIDRETIERIVAQLIDVLDFIDGDTDIEYNGDELDGSAAEDDFCQHVAIPRHPGCPISDPDTADEREPDYPIGEFSDPEARTTQRRRIQRNRCFKRFRQFRNREGQDVWSASFTYQLVSAPKVPTRRQLLTRKRGVPRRARA